MILSMDLGYHTIKAVLLNGDTAIKKFTIPTPHVADGKIENLQNTADSIKEALLENNLKVRHCYFTLPTNTAILKTLEVPRIVEKDMKEYVRTQFSSIMDITEQEVIDYITLDGTSEKASAIGFVIRKPFLEQCINLAKIIGMKCQRINLSFYSLKKYMHAKNYDRDQATIVIHSENGTAEMNLLENDNIFTRVVKLSSQKTEDTDSLLKNWAISFNDSLSIAAEPLSWIQPLAEQITSLVNFQLSNNRQKPVHKVYIYGDCDSKTADELTNITRTPVELLCGEEDISYVNALGTALKYDIANELNLIQAIRQKSPKQKQQIRFYSLIAATFAMILLIELLAGQIIRQMNQSVVRDVVRLEQYLAKPALKQNLAKASNAKKILAEQKQYNTALQTYNTKFETMLRFNSDYIKGVFAQAAAQNITVDYCDYTNGQWSITGYSLNSSIAAEFSGSLEKQNLANEITFKGYERTIDLLGLKYQFELTGTLEGDSIDGTD